VLTLAMMVLFHKNLSEYSVPGTCVTGRTCNVLLYDIHVASGALSALFKCVGGSSPTDTCSIRAIKYCRTIYFEENHKSISQAPVLAVYDVNNFAVRLQVFTVMNIHVMVWSWGL
jgi:hypothetical protein